jgi:hypothetical protein
MGGVSSGFRFLVKMTMLHAKYSESQAKMPTSALFWCGISQKSAALIDLKR